MKRLALSIVSAAALSAPALAQDDAAQRDEDELIPMTLVSPAELEGAQVLWSGGDAAGRVVAFETEDGDVTSILVHDMLPDASVVSRYRIVGEDIAGYNETDLRIVLDLDEDAYEAPL
ncbi:MAG: hypothetical protein RIA71_12845 [Oceanicaulis sp.]